LASLIPIGQQVENAEGVVRPRPELHPHLFAIGEVDDRVGGSRRRASVSGVTRESARARSPVSSFQCALSAIVAGRPAAETRAMTMASKASCAAASLEANRP